MTDDAYRKKIVALLAVQKDLLEKLGAVTQEMDDLCGGGAGIGAQLKDFEQAFDYVWSQRYAKGERGRYVWTFMKDRPHTKRLLKMLGLEELKLRAARYLADDHDQYLNRARHPFGLFVAHVNAYAAPAAATDLELTAPVGCHHSPPCASDVEHTRKRGQEMRQ